MTDSRSHWDHTYTVKPDTEVSWYQPVPDCSLGLIKSAASDPAASIIDVGGGASRLVDRLLADEYSDNGPERCSGLPVQRYSAQTLAAHLGPAFALHAEAAETHQTPFGTPLEFSYALFKRATRTP
jgi:hypothetical protein